MKNRSYCPSVEGLHEYQRVDSRNVSTLRLRKRGGQYVKPISLLSFLSYVKKHLTPCIIKRDIDFR
jgi:hypothetical protein